MDLTHEFTVPAPVETAWAVLTDIPRVARCMPGAALEDQDGDVHRGTVAVKVGALSIRFRGTATITERDDAAHRLALQCDGRDVRGASAAGATVTMALAADGPYATVVRVQTALNLSGRVAQFGRGVLQDVSTALLGRFVRRLEAELDAPTAAETVESVGDPGVRDGDGRVAEPPDSRYAPEPIDLGAVMLPALIRRAAPVAVLTSLTVVLVLAWSRSRRAAG